MSEQFSLLSSAALSADFGGEATKTAPRGVEVLDPAAALAFVTAGPHDVYHLPGYTHACAAFEGGDPIFLLYRGPLGAVFTPLLRRPIGLFGSQRFDAASPYGYPGPLVRAAAPETESALLADALDAMQDWLAEAGLVSAVMRAHPLLTPISQDIYASGRAMQHGEVVLMNLADGYAGMWAELRTRYRSYLNALDRDGVEVREDTAFADLDAWVDVYHQSMRRLNAHPSYFFDANHFARLRAELGRRMRLYFARLKDQVVAGGIFFVCGDHAVWHLNATHDDWLARAPSKAVIWKVAQMLMAEGVRSINVGSGLGARRDALFHFKQGFSKRTAPFSTVRLIGAPDAYAELVAAWRNATTPDDDPGAMFPAYRAPIKQVVEPA
jgi:hypothetical protein